MSLVRVQQGPPQEIGLTEYSGENPPGRYPFRADRAVKAVCPAISLAFGAIDELVKSSAFHAEECEFEPPGITIASLKTALLGCVRPDISV